jgi:hypothetical protein
LLIGEHFTLPLRADGNELIGATLMFRGSISPARREAPQ